MIQLDNNNVTIKKNANIELLKKEFAEHHCFVLTDLFSPSLKRIINLHLQEAHYERLIHEQKNLGSPIAEEYVINHSNLLPSLFHLLFHQEAFVRIIKEITELDQIRSSSGRIYKFTNASNCYDSWHDDITVDNPRLLGFSINLSNEAYKGGEFTLRHKKSKNICRCIQHTNWGNGHFFRIDPRLEHKVGMVTGAEPRQAYAGWYRAKGEMLDCFSNETVNKE